MEFVDMIGRQEGTPGVSGGGGMLRRDGVSESVKEKGKHVQVISM